MKTLSQYAMENKDKVTCLDNGAKIVTLRQMLALLLPNSSIGDLNIYLFLKSIDAKEETRYSIKLGHDFISVHRLDDTRLTPRLCTITYESGDFVVKAKEEFNYGMRKTEETL